MIWKWEGEGDMEVGGRCYGKWEGGGVMASGREGVIWKWELHTIPCPSLRTLQHLWKRGQNALQHGSSS